MHSTIASLIESRVSANYYDASRSLAQDVIVELARLASLSPSAFNLQNWRFIAVHSPLAKARLKKAAFGQQKVQHAQVTFIVCGKLGPHKDIAAALRPAVDAAILPRETADSWTAMVEQAYPGNVGLQRDEAIRSASLAAMTLMLAAEGMGLASCPMTGFRTDEVVEQFSLGADELPVMLVTVGYASQANWRQKPRKTVAELLDVV